MPPTYGRPHRRARAHLLATYTPGQPCPRCGQPIQPGQPVDAGHHDTTNRYRGLEHQACNRATSTHRAALRRRPTDSHPGLR